MNTLTILGIGLEASIIAITSFLAYNVAKSLKVVNGITKALFMLLVSIVVYHSADLAMIILSDNCCDFTVPVLIHNFTRTVLVLSNVYLFIALRREAMKIKKKQVQVNKNDCTE